MSYPILRLAKIPFLKVRYTANTTFLALDAHNQIGDYPYYLKYRCLTLEQGEGVDCAYDKVSTEVKGQHAAQGRIPTSTEAQGHLNPRDGSDKRKYISLRKAKRCNQGKKEKRHTKKSVLSD